MRKFVWVGVAVVLAGSAAGWAMHRSAGRDPQPTARAQARDAGPSPGQPRARTVALDADAVKEMGLGVTVLRAARHAPQLRTAAVVLSPRGLAILSAAYAADAGKLAMARASLAVAHGEYQRQSVLYRQDQTTSLKALQAARGALASSRAQTNAARLQLHFDALAVRQQWGPVLGKWLVARSPALEKILGGQEWLVQVTFGARNPRSAPQTSLLIVPSGPIVPARLVSSFPQTNPVIQGLNFLYVIPARPGFAPGLNLMAEIPAGPARSGVVIPASAVIWSQGRAWAYKQIASGRFERLPVATGEPVTDGWFVTAGFAPGDRVVTGAAEELFSAETQQAGGGQGDEGDDD
ncbi:MAG TPA: hypothetical protein VNJ52_00570 [Patescibacteria group bacterium]|nr:hypothetical protein [Patescibacteria group bacterium]